jgi:GH15 family glucan-1,4-alpha-glucosidase
MGRRRFLLARRRRLDFRVTYKPHTLAAISLATNERLGISLAIEEGVHPRHNLFLRRIKIRNLAQVEREIRPFLHYSLALGGNDIGDTAFYDPESKGMCHFKRDIFFLYGGMFGGEGIHQYTVQKRFGGFEGGRFDAEDGELYWRPVDQGAIDSWWLSRPVASPEVKRYSIHGWSPDAACKRSENLTGW